MTPPVTTKHKPSPDELKLEICRLRLQHMSTPEIAAELHCTRQYVSRVLNALSAGSEDFADCPYPLLRAWAKKGTESMEEVAAAIGMSEDDLRAAVITDSNERMPEEVAERLSAYTGLDAKRLARNERPVRPKYGPPEPKKGAYTRVKYPAVRKYLKDHNMTITTFAIRCGQPYPLVYRTITATKIRDAATNPVCVAVANLVGKPVAEVFKQ